MSKTFLQILADLEIKNRKQVTFKVIETHGMPVCRNYGTLVDGYLHAKECGNFDSDRRDVLGEKMFINRLRILQIRESREQEIDKMFAN
jgi:hypothetical protein